MIRQLWNTTKPPSGVIIPSGDQRPRGGFWLLDGYNGPLSGLVQDAALRNPGATRTGGITTVKGNYSSQSLNFDGSTGFIDVSPGAAVDDVHLTGFTAWISYKSTGPGATQPLLCKTNGLFDNQGWTWIIGSGGAVRFEAIYTVADVVSQTASTQFTANVPQMLAVTWDGSTSGANVKHYSNGQLYTGALTTQNASGSHNSDSGDHLFIGKGVSPFVGFFSGVIDFVGIDRRVYSAGEIADLYVNPFRMFQRRIFMPAGSAAGAVYTWQWL